MDLLQVLWCPNDHYDDHEGEPLTAIRWRRAADVHRGNLQIFACPKDHRHPIRTNLQ